MSQTSSPERPDQLPGRAPRYGIVHTSDEFGRILRTNRKRQGVTLETVSDFSTLGLRFLSELERGKEGASLGKSLRAANMAGLEVIMLPKDIARRVLAIAEREIARRQKPGAGGDG